MQNTAMYIYMAQVASDAGKGIYDLVCYKEEKIFKKAQNRKYAAKDEFIIKALENIRRFDANYHFSVVIDVEKRANYIVYFIFKVEGKRYQVSFHSFDNKLKRYVRTDSRFLTKWDEKSCRNACRKLYKLF